MSPPPPQDQPPDSSAVDELFELLRAESRRRILYYLREHGGTVEVDELREHLAERMDADSDEVDVVLAHVALPKLADSGVIEYERESEQVRYEGDPMTTELLELVEDRERTND